MNKEEITDALNMFFDYRIENMHTLIPGKIISYDEGERLAEVEPLIKLKTVKEIDVTFPTISNVPVIFPSGKAFSFRWDLQKGDGCLILFSESSIGNFLNSSGSEQIEAEDSSRFSLTDAICLPGLWTKSKASDLSKDLEMYIDKDGLITIKSNNLDVSTSENIVLSADGDTEVNGANIKLNGDSKSFVTFSELDTALQTFIGVLNAHVHTSAAPGSPTSSPVTPMTLNISSSQTTTVKTGG